MSFDLTKLSAIPIGFDQLFKRICQARIAVAKPFGSGQSGEKALLCLLEIAVFQCIISRVKKLPPFLIHTSAPRLT